MKIYTIPVGYIRTNCYIFHEENSSECVIVDPGDEPKKIMNVLEEEKLTPKFIILTHGHFDHIYAIPKIHEVYPDIPVIAFEKEKELVEDEVMNGSKGFHRRITIQPDALYSEGEQEILGMKFRVIHTPGHTAGSACFYFPEAEACFTGDTLFFENIGRSDLPTGDGAQEIKSIKEKLFVLPDETKVLPGHGPASTIGHEKANNSFFQ